MIDFNPNSTARIFITLSDNNLPLTGATVTVTVTNPAGTVIINNQTASEEGNGIYSYTLLSSHTVTIGTYFVTWNITSPSTLEQTTTFVVGYQSAYSWTRLDVRHACAMLVEGKIGFLTGKVASATSGSITDTSRIEPTNSLAGHEFYVYGGTAAGQTTRIDTTNPTTGVVTVKPSFTVTPATNDLYEIHGKFRIDDFNRAIRMALTDVADEVLVPISSEAITLASDTYEYAIPAGFSHLFEIQVNVLGSDWRTVAAGAWNVKRSVRKLSINRGICWSYGGQKLRILGLRPPTDLLDDMTGVDVMPTYLVKKASAYLCLMMMQSRENEPGGWTTKHQMFEVESQVLRGDLNHGIPANTRRVE